MGQILFSIFLNELRTVSTKSQLYHFEEVNTISGKNNNTDGLLEILKEKSESSVKCFRENRMIVNPVKFCAIVLQERNENKITNITLTIENIGIIAAKSSELNHCSKIIGVAIDSKLNFEVHFCYL